MNAIPLELTGRCLLILSMILTLASTAGADEMPVPKTKAKETDPIKVKGEWFGKKVIAKRDSNEIQIADWEGDKLISWEPYALMYCTVREDKDGYLLVHDGRREGWVRKEDMVTSEDALAYFDKAVKSKPEDIYARYIRGVIWVLKGEFDKALIDINEAIRLSPKHAKLYSTRGNVWLAKKEYDKAIADYNKNLQLDPKDTFAYCYRGKAWSEKREYDKAITDFTEALRLEPNNELAYYLRGIAWGKNKQYDKAIADFTESLRLAPKHVNAYYYRGGSWRAKYEFDKAIADFTEVLKLDPKHVNAYYYRGHLWSVIGENDKAIADFTEVLKLDPKHVNAYYYPGAAWLAKNEFEKAIADFNEALKIEPDDISSLDNLARTLATCPVAKLRDGKKAVELAKKAVEKAGNRANWNRFQTLAAAYAEAGDFELAVSEQRKAIDMAKADKSTDPDELKAIESRLDLYLAKKPFRDK